MKSHSLSSGSRSAWVSSEMENGAIFNMAVLPAKLCEMLSMSKKLCEPERIYMPVWPSESMRVWMYENSFGAYWASSMMRGVPKLLRKPRASSMANSRRSGSSNDTYRIVGKPFLSKVDLPHCRVPVMVTTGYFVSKYWILSIMLRSIMFLKFG